MVLFTVISLFALACIPGLVLAANDKKKRGKDTDEELASSPKASGAKFCLTPSKSRFKRSPMKEKIVDPLKKREPCLHYVFCDDGQLLMFPTT